MIYTFYKWLSFIRRTFLAFLVTVVIMAVSVLVFTMLFS